MDVARAKRGDLWIAGAVAVVVFGLLEASSSAKVSLYLDAFEHAGLLYVAPLAALAAMYFVLLYPQVPLQLIAFLLPFNFVGGVWGDSLVALLAKVSMNVLVAAALLPTVVAPAGQRAWLTGTRIGIASLGWLAAIAMGILIGLMGNPNRNFWVRESGWMFFFAAALPVGTLLRDRINIERLLFAICAGVALLQAYAFWTLMTGTRYTRIDIQGMQAFFRAPYSCVSLFGMYLAAASLLYRASARTLTWRSGLLLFAAVAFLAGGLLASMVRSLWICGALGMLLVVFLAPHDRRTRKAVAAVSGGAILAVTVVAAIDRLSPQSSGDWTGTAIAFLQDLGSKDSTSRVTREVEWGHALEVWKQSPLVGVGFGYAFPQRGLEQIPDEVRPEAFFMHNSYLNILAKTGIVGLAAFLAFIWSVARGAHAVLRRPDVDAGDRALATAIVAAVASVALLTSTVPVLTAGDSPAYLGMLAGLTVALQRSARRSAP